MKTYLLKIWALILFACCLLGNKQAYAQTESQVMSSKDWKRLVGYLQKGKSDKSLKMSEKLLQEHHKDDNGYESSYLRYIMIYSASAQLAAKKISKEECVKLLEHLQGQSVITPTRKFQDCLFNCVFWVERDAYKGDPSQDNNNASASNQGNDPDTQANETISFNENKASTSKDPLDIAEKEFRPVDQAEANRANELVFTAGDKEYRNQLQTTVSDEKSTKIYAFESYLVPAETPAELLELNHNMLNSDIRIKGQVRSIVAEGHSMPRLRIEYLVESIHHSAQK